MSAKKQFRYVGDGFAFVPGVPSRDLYEDDDADALRIAEENSQTPTAVFVAVKHRQPEEPAADEKPAKTKAKDTE